MWPPAPPDPGGAGQRLSLQPSEIAAAIRWISGLDVLPQDIVALVRDVEDPAVDRQWARCGWSR